METCKYNLTELPEGVVALSEENRPDKSLLKWSGTFPVPAVGTAVKVTMNEYWRVARDIATGPSGDPKLRLTRYPKLRATMWARSMSMIPAVAPFYAKWNPIKTIVRYLRLQRMLDQHSSDTLKKFFRICHARQVAYGWTMYLSKARAESRAMPALSVRQKRITLLVQINQRRRLANAA